MNLKERLQKLITELDESEISAYYDEEIEIDCDEIEIELDDYENIFIKLYSDTEYMDIYLSFHYFDAKKEERNDVECLDFIKEDALTYLFQKKMEDEVTILNHTITSWEDEYSYLCPGVDVRIGVRNVPVEVSVIKEFIYKIEEFYRIFDELSVEEIQERELDKILIKYGIYDGRCPFEIARNDVIDYKPIKDEKIFCWVGKDYVLYKNTERHVYVNRCYYDLYMDFLQRVELFDDLSYEIRDDVLQIKSCSFLAKIPCHTDDTGINIELLYLKSQLMTAIPFLNTENKLVLADAFKSGSEAKEVHTMYLPTIFTEGHTDWLHIKSAFDICGLEYKNLFKFEEYAADTQIGDKELLSMCRTFSKEHSNQIRIMIFDRDGSVANKDVEDATKGFKSWGNHVYSLPLPIPNHRTQTPDICIEHYYTDKEIKKEYYVGGLLRRLYLGYEFDKFGRAPKLCKLCLKENLCGEDKISIIDDKVYENDSGSETNYALSKMEFAKQTTAIKMLSFESQNAFSLLYDKIIQILQFDSNR